MKIRYAVRRVINTGDFENIAIEFEMEGSLRLGQSEQELTAELVSKVEALIEAKEAEIRGQLK